MGILFKQFRVIYISLMSICSYSACLKIALYPLYSAILMILIPESAHATQMHNASEGVVVHQIGHLFFLVSMVILYFTIREKSLDSQKGWRFIQIAALLFVLWNLDALIVHFLDNQIELISPVPLSICDIKIDMADNRIPISNNTYADKDIFLIWFYYFLRLDHLLSVPGMILLWRGLYLIVQQDISMSNDPDIYMNALQNISIKGNDDIAVKDERL
ncbi:MAG: hypothetical protein HQK72_03285 [Desulfamplus sp.]|nr:hypothetical protein [Desulfamplus sp.]